MSSIDRAKIYTFYSYKGGVGRSMALANIAELLYRKGLRVLMIDFDLEAPGLEQYFYQTEDPRLHKLLCTRGLIDLLFSYRSLRALSDPKQLLVSPDDPAQQTSASSAPDQISSGSNFPYAVEPLSNFINKIYPARSNQPGTLSIMTAGRRAKEELISEGEGKQQKDEFALYADRVRSFAWDDFYLNFDGELFFDWFREEAIKDVDIVLIDSRTGVAEMSGVCTYQLADVVAMFAAANNQNIDGIKKVADSLASHELIKEGRKGRELSLIFVPSRVDLSEKEKLDDLSVRFRRVADRWLSPILKFETHSFADLKIPYIPYYSFVEEVAVRETESTAALEMKKAYENICRCFAQLDPKVSEKFSSDSEVRPNLAEQQNRIAEQIYDQLSPSDQLAARGLFTRLVRLAQVEEGELKDSARTARVTELTVPQIEVAGEFTAAELLVFSRDADNQATVGFATDTLINSWSRLKEWISEDRDFLLWRQKLWTAAGDWLKSGRDAAFLLPSARSVEAEKWYASHKKDLTHLESEYIFASLSRRRRERWLKYAGLIFVVSTLAALIYIFWILKTTTPEETRSRQLASNSEAVLSYLPEQSLLLAVEAVRLSPTAEAQQALRKVLRQSRLRTVIRVGGTAYSAQFSHDGRRIVTGSGGGYKVAQIWEPGNVNRWQNLLILSGHEGDVRAAAFSPNDKLVATASHDGTAILWDAVTGQMIGPRSTVSHMSLSDLAWSSDGTLVAAASLATNQVYVWDVPGKKLIKTLVGFTDNVNSVAFSPSGSFLAAGSKDNSVLVWDFGMNWKEAAPPLLGHTNEVLSVRFSQDGKFLVTTGGENTARVWSTSSWRTVTVFSEHSARITRASFSPDGKLIVTASEDNSAKIWETLTGKLIAELRGSLGAVNDASFSPDGKLILTASDFTARLWDLNPEIDLNSSMAELTSFACTRVTRNLTEAEWLQYMGSDPYRLTCPEISPQPTPTPTSSTSPVLQSSNSPGRESKLGRDERKSS